MLPKSQKTIIPNKAHGHDMISIQMPNLYGDSVLPPSELLFKSCLDSRMFPSEWKKTHVILVHKNFGKHFLNIYRPIALLFICQKIFQRLMCQKIFLYFIGNNLISYNQSRFKPRDSCINHLLCIIYDEDYETREVFLDISKILDKVWLKVLLHKLKKWYIR